MDQSKHPDRRPLSARAKPPGDQLLRAGLIRVALGAFRSERTRRRMLLAAAAAMLWIQCLLTVAALAPGLLNPPKPEDAEREAQKKGTEETKELVMLPGKLPPENRLLEHAKPVQIEPPPPAEKSVSRRGRSPAELLSGPPQPALDHGRDAPRPTAPTPLAKPAARPADPRESPAALNLRRQLQSRPTQSIRAAEPDVVRQEEAPESGVEAPTRSVTQRRGSLELQRPAPQEIATNISRQPRAEELRRPTSTAEPVASRGENTPRALSRPAPIALAPILAPAATERPEAGPQEERGRDIERSVAGPPDSNITGPPGNRVTGTPGSGAQADFDGGERTPRRLTSADSAAPGRAVAIIDPSTQTLGVSRRTADGPQLAAPSSPAVPTPSATTENASESRPTSLDADSRATPLRRADDSIGQLAYGGRTLPAQQAALEEKATLEQIENTPLSATVGSRPAAPVQILRGVIGGGGGSGIGSRQSHVSSAAAKVDIPAVESGPGGESRPQVSEPSGIGLTQRQAGDSLEGPAGGVASGNRGGASLEPQNDRLGSSHEATRASAPLQLGPGSGSTVADGGAALREPVGAPHDLGIGRVEVDTGGLVPSGAAVEPGVGPSQAGPESGGVRRRASGAELSSVAPIEPGTGTSGDVGTPGAGGIGGRAEQRDDRFVGAADSTGPRRDVGRPRALVDSLVPQGPGSFADRPQRARDRRSGIADGGSDAASRHAGHVGASIKAGLDFLQRHQSPPGNWSLHQFGQGRPGYENESASIHSDVAATGLALLAMLGEGYHHMDAGGPYTDTIRRGLEYLINHQQPSGEMYVGHDAKSNESARLYSHAIATLALSEALGLSRDPALREPAQRAINFALAAQNKQLGGWRYTPGESSDTSVTGWMFGALDAGSRAGLKVPDQAFEGINRWLDQAAVPGSGGGKFVYEPNAVEETNEWIRKERRSVSPTMTAVGLYIHLSQRWPADDPRAKSGAEYLLENLPAHKARNTYYWYYATQVMFHMKGTFWQRWRQSLEDELIGTQVATGPLLGSWEPGGNFPDRWGASGGRIYVTAMNLLSLEADIRINEPVRHGRP